jgi:hypothetical protein
MRSREQRQNRETTPSSIFVHSVSISVVVVFVVLIAIVIRTPVITSISPQAFVMGEISIVVISLGEIGRCMSFQGITSSRRAWRRGSTCVLATIDSIGASPGASQQRGKHWSVIR